MTTAPLTGCARTDRAGHRICDASARVGVSTKARVAAPIDELVQDQQERGGLAAPSSRASIATGERRRMASA